MQSFSYNITSRNTPLFLNNIKTLIQRIFLIVYLLCGILNAEGMASSSKDSQWQSYFGVEGGVGAMSFFQLFWLHSISL